MLIVEDDKGLLPSLEQSFTRRGYEVLGVSTVSEATKLLKQRGIDLALLDIQLPDGSGLDVLTTAQNLDNETVIVMMTAFPEVKTAVQAMKQGASDFVIKPFDLEELHLTVERAMETRRLRRNVHLLKREKRVRDETTEMLGNSSAIKQVQELIGKVAKTDSIVLVTGETGTGKELVADTIYRLSVRSEGPMVKVNCSAVSEQLLESELVGHEKGAFTDARETRAGLFEMANGGTLMLDEISEMKPDLQTKLLRVVEGQPFRRIGGQREIQTNVRIIAVTNRVLSSQVQAGLFRQDLFFRLNVFEINLPPLRNRGGDIVLLARHFLQRCASALRKGQMHLTDQVEELLLRYQWPGNVRELRNVVERAAILCETDQITVAILPVEIQSSAFLSKQTNSDGSLSSLNEMNHRYVSHVLQSLGGNIAEAARVLGISRNTLKAKLGNQPSAGT